MGTLRVFSAAYHPQTNGAVERINKTLKEMLKGGINPETNNWDEELPFVLYAYRTSVHTTTGQTPFYMIYGHDPAGPHDLALQPKKKPTAQDQYLVDLAEKLRRAREMAMKGIQEQSKRDKSLYDRKARPQVLKPGDLVAVRWVNVKKGVAKKLAPKYRGPFRILEVNWPNVRVVRVGDHPNKVYDYHMNTVKRYLMPKHYDPDLDRDTRSVCAVCKGIFGEDEPGSRWICCDICDQWFHYDCQGMKRAPAKDKPWYCKECKELQEDE